jgi:hypothetical protein
LLKDLASGEPVSPTAFSLSVHNATAGLFSIQQGLTKNITAISCGDADLVPALLETLGQCHTNEPKVMCVFCDEPPPDIYRDQVSQPEFAYAVALIISCGEDWTLGVVGGEAEIPIVETKPQSLELLALLNGSTFDLQVVHNRTTWQLSRSVQ